MPAALSQVTTSQLINWIETVFGNVIKLPYQFGGPVQLSVAAAGTANTFQSTYGATLSVVNPTTTALNLTNTLPQPDGTLATFVDIVMLAINCPTTNTDFITFGGGTDPVAYFGAAKAINPGQTSTFFWPAANAFPVTATTADRINLNSNSGTQTVNVLIVGH